MTQPRALLPWAQPLSELADEVAAWLGPWVARIDRSVGSLQVRVAATGDDPDGFAGIDRRGPYHRLLTSEWLIADELPDEFLRRAVMGEHQFLAVAHQQPIGVGESLAFFDGGPDQLGSPRLAHIAMAIVLAQRAERAGIPFYFAPLQEPNRRVLWRGPMDLMALLSARYAYRADEELTDLPEDVWVIGGRAAMERVRGVHTIYVSDALDGQLQVDVVPLGRPGQSIQLNLPGLGVALRTLRNPFPEPKSTPREAVTNGPVAVKLQFSHDGRRLLVRLRDGRWAAWNLPVGPEDPGKVRLWREPGHLVAIGWWKRSFVGLVVREGRWYLAGGPFDREVLPPLSGQAPVVPTDGAGRLVILRDADVALFCDARGWVYSLPLRGPGELCLVDVDVTHFDAAGLGAIWLRGGKEWVSTAGRSDPDGPVMTEWPAWDIPKEWTNIRYLGRGPTCALGDVGSENGLWFHGERMNASQELARTETPLQLTATTTPIGWASESSKLHVGLYVFEGDTLFRFSHVAMTPQTFERLSAPIDAAEICGDVLAVVTQTHLELFGLQRRRLPLPEAP